MPSPSLRPEPVCVERVVPAPPEAVFDLLSRPERHRDFDGSGTVQGARREGRRLGLGDSFGMDMHWRVPYATRNVVTEFEEGRRIAWRTLAPTPLTLLAPPSPGFAHRDSPSGGTPDRPGAAALPRRRAHRAGQHPPRPWRIGHRASASGRHESAPEGIAPGQPLS